VVLIVFCAAYPGLAYDLIPVVDTIRTTGKLFPTEDEYFGKEYPDAVELRSHLPGEDWQIRVVFLTNDLLPYVFRERRKEWPAMRTIGSANYRPQKGDYIVQRTGEEWPTMNVTRVAGSGDLTLFEVT
jgi:hypothetical protein